jgi:hypothetical protein
LESIKGCGRADTKALVGKIEIKVRMIVEGRE